MLAIPAAQFGCFFDENCAAGIGAFRLRLVRKLLIPIIECLTNYISGITSKFMRVGLIE
jgi:hypothetical protein